MIKLIVKRLLVVSLAALSLMSLTVSVQAKDLGQSKKPAKTEQYAGSLPQPKLSEIAYGDHAPNILDFWKASPDKPTPLVFVIHCRGSDNAQLTKENI